MNEQINSNESLEKNSQTLKTDQLLSSSQLELTKVLDSPALRQYLIASLIAVCIMCGLPQDTLADSLNSNSQVTMEKLWQSLDVKLQTGEFIDKLEYSKSTPKQIVNPKIKQTLWLLGQINKQLEINNKDKGDLLKNIEKLVEKKTKIDTMTNKELREYDDNVLHSLYEGTLHYWRKQISLSDMQLDSLDKETLEVFSEILVNIDLYESNFQKTLSDKIKAIIDSKK